jgi:hypothetical protein
MNLFEKRMLVGIHLGQEGENALTPTIETSARERPFHQSNFLALVPGASGGLESYGRTIVLRSASRARREPPRPHPARSSGEPNTAAF